MTKKKPNLRKKILPGDVVVWDPGPESNLLTGLSEKQRKKYYGSLGYGASKKKVFVFLSPINDCSAKRFDSGHCVLVDLADGHLEVMVHTCELRHARDEEF